MRHLFDHGMNIEIACSAMAEKAASVASVSMLQEASKVIGEPSVLRRILFATSLLPSDTPKLWEIIAKFSTYQNGLKSPVPSQIKLLTENITFIDKDSLVSDDSLLKELVFMPFGKREHVGLSLISDKEHCESCGGKLLLRSDRPSNITLYTESYGTLPAIHYRKYCANSKQGCNVVQHFGYHTKGRPSKLYYDIDWEELQYIISSQETAFEISLLQKYDFELLIGQVSYKQ